MVKYQIYHRRKGNKRWLKHGKLISEVDVASKKVNALIRKNKAKEYTMLFTTRRKRKSD